jgi:hypothetical protein
MVADYQAMNLHDLEGYIDTLGCTFDRRVVPRAQEIMAHVLERSRRENVQGALGATAGLFNNLELVPTAGQHAAVEELGVRWNRLIWWPDILA